MYPAFATLGAIAARSAPAQQGSLCARRARVTRVAVRACAPASTKAGLEAAWAPFAERMRETNESPPLEDWNKLLGTALSAGDPAASAIWALERMQESGRKPTAATYEILLEICLKQDDRAAAFMLVEKMWQDKVLLGDVTLPDDMEKTLRAILPPEAFD